MKNYSYIEFANDVSCLMDMCDGHIDKDLSQMREKWNDWMNSLIKKAEYSATHKKAATGAKPETIERGMAIYNILSSTPMTTEDINKKMKSDFSALQISNYLKYCGKEIKKTKVVKPTVSSTGLKAEKLFTAYSI